MAVLENQNLKIQIDKPSEKYSAARFDWTGKIAEVRYQNIPLTATERVEQDNKHVFGRGFYNEFGIETALGFEEAKLGEWFHKIGVGLLKKEGKHYHFGHSYEIRPAKFKTSLEADRFRMECKSENNNGYAYVLKKTICLLKQGFTIEYSLENTGNKIILTDEYVHNFIGLNNEPIGKHYQIQFPFPLHPEGFDEKLNPEKKVIVDAEGIRFKGPITQQIFYSQLNGDRTVPASWELINENCGISIKEMGSFQTNKVNLWGDHHVVSPEIFHQISLAAGETTSWSRSFHFGRI